MKIASLGMTVLVGVCLVMLTTACEQSEEEATATASPMATGSPRATATATATAIASPTASPPPTPTPPATTPTRTPTALAEATPTPTRTVAAEATPTPTPSVAGTPSLTPTATAYRGIELCPGDDRAVALLVGPSLLSGIRSSLDQFETDLCSEGYAVIETVSDFAVPPDVRAHLAELYAQTEEHLVGAILIGDLPHPYQWVTLTSANPDIPPSSEEAISFQYYADLDGVFEASPGYASPGGHPYSYDVHGGDVDWEIWIGVLPPYLGDPASTAEAINRYFGKNHAYRAGEYDLPRSFLQVNEHFKAETQEEHTFFLNALRSDQYAWTPFSDAPNAHLYFDSPFGGLSVDQGYADLSAGVADFTVVDAHGYWGASGKLDIAWVDSNPVGTAFFWSNGCAVGDLDHADNFLTSVLYSPTSMVLVAKGTTNDSGGMGTNENGSFGHNMATALSLGESFGEAMLSHVNVPLIHPWADSAEYHFATPVILGDPTLRLQP